ncbi:MAG: hypothetical protein IKF58_08100 [Bacillus sp. (in: Bacteria)]|uniref:hypothetical protein n=1 Tax=Exiguobacterium profundum TaxID=307643 RepID=UPI00289EBCC1|nr:hypothetical protein [Exiguobacterium profundum]MBR3206359.1 hypothetical protein [Bacillus sp. (in: firmicutes)]
MEWFMSMDVLVVLLAVGSIVIGAVTSLFIAILLIWLIVRYLRSGGVVKKWVERLRQARSKDRV